MRRLIYTGFISIVLLAGNTSCNKWLDLKPKDGIVGKDYWKTKEQLSAAVTGVYASLLDKSMTEYLFMWGELRADMVDPALSASADDVNVKNVNLVSTSNIVNWRTVYRTINYCNTVIEFAPKVLETDPTLTQEQLDHYLSEAYAIRALMYFYLVRSFGDVPLKLTATTSDEQLEQLAKSKQADVLNQIVADLTKAEPMAVFTFGSKGYDKGRVTRYTINAIQADVYLWMEKYNECVTACNKITDANKFGLMAHYEDIFVNGGNTNESIFELQFDAQATNNFFNLFSTSRRRYMVSAAVMEDIYTIDYDNPDSIDYRGDFTVAISSNTINKFLDNSTAEASYNHWIIYRLADVLLMKAEALNQLEKGREALDIVYAIRQRGHALPQTDLAPPDDDKDGIADFILAERAREFSFEGKRWYDILRNSKRDNYRRLEQVLIKMVTATVPPARQQSAINKYRDYNSHYFPIYFYELQTDKNLVQNPFYL